MATIVTRAGKGSPLTNTEVDANFTNLNTDKIEADSTDTLSNKTLTAPKFADGGYIADANGNELVKMETTASAVNELQVTNAATGNGVEVAASGDDTNIDLDLTAKGSGQLVHKSVAQFDEGITEDSTAITSSSGTATVDLSVGSVFTITLSENTTFVFSNPAASGYSTSFVLVLTQDSSARTVTWPASVKWAGGSAPTISTGSGDHDLFVFTTTDAGTNYWSTNPGLDFS